MSNMMRECRTIYEQLVNKTIRPEAREEFLKVGSSHWLDFKNGYLMGHHQATVGVSTVPKARPIDTESHHFTQVYLYDGSPASEDDMSVPRIAELNVAIYPMDDDAFKDGIADDVLIEDIRTGEYVGAGKNLSKLIMEELKKRTDEWSEIRALGAANCKSYIEERRVDEALEDRLEHRELHKQWRDNE